MKTIHNLDNLIAKFFKRVTSPLGRRIITFCSTLWRTTLNPIPKKYRLIVLSIAIPILLVIGGFGIYQALHPGNVKASWFDNNWVYRKAISISAHTAAETNVYINLNSSNALDTSDTTRFQTDCGDLRFTNQSGALLKYYIVSGCGTTSTVIHVQLSSFPAGAQTIYYYYANPSVANGFQPSDFSTEATNYTIGSVGTEEQAPGPVAYWKFDDGQGTTAKDATMQANNGTLGTGVSAPTWQSEDQCISGKCLYFPTGGNSYVDMGSSTALNFASTASFTIATWFKSTGGGFLIAKGTSGNCYNYEINISGTTVQFGNTANSTNIATGISTGTWYHLAVVYNNSTVTPYLNGVALSPITKSTSGCSQSLKIGYAAGGAPQYFNGYIDDLKIYNYARSGNQILADYNGRGNPNGGGVVLGASTQNNSALNNGLVGYWRMDETASPASDSSGNGSNGTWTGSAASAAGKFGNGGSFPGGTGSYISIANNSNFNFGSSNFTLSAWIKTNSTTTPQTILSHFDNGSPFAGWDFAMNVAGACGSGKICMWDGSSWQGVTSGITASTWTHVMAVRNGTTVTFYVNGTSVGTITIQASIPTSTNTFRIGDSGDAVRSFNGTIDETRIYNRALSPAEVTTLYNFAPGPVGYWDFEDGSGTSVKDKSGNANTGTWAGTGAKHWLTGKYGSAGNFNGTDDKITGSYVNTYGGLTLSAWINPTQTSGTYAAIWNGLSGSNDNNKANQIYILAGSIYFRAGNGSSYTTVSGGTVNTNTWTHVSATDDGTTLKIYVNGVLISSTAAVGAVYNASPGTLIFGEDSLNNYPFSGKLDEVKVYNYARTQAQIVSDMNAGHPNVGSPVGSPIGYWKFDEGYGITANNSGNGGSTLNGTLTNMASPATSTSGWTNSGKFGKALTFNSGSSTYVTMGNQSALNFTDSFSLSAWIKTTASPTGGNYSTIVSKGALQGSTNGYALFLNGDNLAHLTFQVRNSSTIVQLDGGVVNDNNWHHVLAVRNHSINTSYIYVDGILKASDATTSLTNYSSTGNFGIGGNYTVAGAVWSFFFTGSIDEVKVYPYALTADQVKLDMNQSQSQVLGALSDAANGGNSAAAEYCIPGDTSTCSAPVGRWDFDESSGTTVNDTSGNSNTGTWSGTGAHWTPGKIGFAGNFNGSDDYVSVGDTTSLQLTTTGTVEAWIYPTSVSGTHVIFRKNNGSSPFDGYILYANNTDLVFRWDNTGTTNQVTASGILSANAWYHVVGIQTGSGIQVYLNGSLVASGGSANSLTSKGYSAQIASSASDRLIGKIDQVRVFNYARTAAQVAWDYNRGGPVGWWKMDECQGTTINDASGNANTGTLIVGATGSQTSAGTCTASGTTAWYQGKTGKFNSSLNFDGTDDYVDAGSSNTITSNNITTCAWVKPAVTSRGDIVTRWNSGVGNSQFDLLYGLTTGKPQFYITDGTAPGIKNSGVGSTTMSTGRWYYICGTYNGSTVAVYLNGTLESSAAASITLNTTSLYNYRIGDNSQNGNGSSGANPLTGQIDDVRVFNYALTGTQIQQLYNGGFGFRVGPSTGSP